MNNLPPENPESIGLMIQSILEDPNARDLLVKKTCACGDIVYKGHMCHLCGFCQTGCCNCAPLTSDEPMKT